MEVTPGGVSAVVGVLSLVGGGALAWVRDSLAAQKATQKVLFEKYDAVCDDLQDFKLHAAETYVNQAALEKALTPINETLKELRRDLKGERR